MTNQKGPSPVKFWGQYESFRKAAEILSKSGRGESIMLLNPIYLLLGFSAESLFKSCLPTSTKGHDLFSLYKQYLLQKNAPLNLDGTRALQYLRKRYHPGTSNNSVRYPEQGSKSFMAPSDILAMLDDLETNIEPLIRQNQAVFMSVKYGK